MDVHFTVKDEHNEIQPLEVVESNEGRCTLGVVLAPDGSHEQAVKYLRGKTDTWAAYIKTGHIC